MENLIYYDRFKSVPEEAKKKITGGRLKGFTDINPMWRIKTLTDAFGPCGVGWNVVLVNERIVPGGNKGEVALFVDVELTYKTESGEWSAPIFGTGGSMLVSNEEKGLRLDDEAFKKAYTDAISVACKVLGIGADVYWDKDSTKYPTDQQPADKTEQEFPPEEVAADDALADVKLRRKILKLAKDKGISAEDLVDKAEGYIKVKFGVVVKFDDMNVEQLNAVGNKITAL